MDILIKGMEMPKEGRLTLQISADGAVYVVNSCSITAETYMTDAVPIPSHGRLIDADALKVSLVFAEKTAEWAVPALRAVLMVIDEMPTIIPTEEGE